MSKLVKKLNEFIGIHTGNNIIVCGCGTSLLDLKEIHNKYITIGVNDVPRLFDPTYLLVTDHQGRFGTEERKKLINNSKAKYLFTATKGWRHQNIVYFELGSKSLRNLDDKNKIDHFVNSPYVAVNLAYKFGAKNIGIIGVDFTNGHFYNVKDGPHPIVRLNALRGVNEAYQKLSIELKKRGVGLYNLSQHSNLKINKITLTEFDNL